MDFITPFEAKKIIKEELISTIKTKTVLLKSLYKYTSEDIYSPIDFPNFDNSAMDGYAFSYQEYLKNGPLKVSHIVKAGSTQSIILKPGEAARIYTGAPIPIGADTVIMQEKAIFKNNLLEISRKNLIKGINIRLKGSQTQKGELLISKNTYITPGIIGYLANFGFTHISVYANPKIGIITTGNELIEGGQSLKYGQIYESNSIAFYAALAKVNLKPKFSIKIKDNKESTIEAIKNYLDKVDILLITGGISVGDYDFVKESLDKNNIKKLFYKVQQKPGKPLYFGKKGSHFIFALPGNPASAFTCFYQYVLPFIERMKGNLDFNKNQSKAILNMNFEKKNSLTFFLKGKYIKNTVEILTAQESYKMNSFAEANCLIEISGESRTINKGEEVTIWKI